MKTQRNLSLPRRFIYLLAFFLCGLLLFQIFSRILPSPILIGFSGELTGKNANAAVSERSGVQLALDEINQAGGIQGRPLRLIIMDDQGNPEKAREADMQLIQGGVTAIIGHTTSGQTLASLDLINQNRVVMISPTASSSQFNNLDDYFFRITPDTSQIGQALGDYILQRKLQNLVTVNEQKNLAFSQQIHTALQNELQKEGPVKVHYFSYSEGETDLDQLAIEIHSVKPDGVIFIAPGIDTALLAQYLRLRGSTASFVASQWAQSSDLTAKGGRAVEGMVIAAIAHPDNQNPAYLRFKQRFSGRYRSDPDFFAAYGYETMQVLAEGLRLSEGRPEKLKQALTSIQNFPAIQGSLSITATGDCIREVYMVEIRQGEYQWLQTVLPHP